MKAIIVKYLPATNTLPARYRASAEGVKPYLASVNLASHSPAYAVVALCLRMGWTGTLVSGGLPNGDEVFCFTDSSALTVPTVHYRAGDGTRFASEKNALSYASSVARRTGAVLGVERVPA